MPYERESAHHRSLQRLSTSERVKELFGQVSIRERDPAGKGTPSLPFIEVDRGDWQPTVVIAIDGSHLEVDIRNGFPGAEASYVTVACVVLDVAKMRALDSERPVDPKAFREIQSAGSVDCALPGCNVVYSDEVSANASLRRALFETLAGERAFTDGESLLETYEVLLASKPASPREQRCPYEDCLSGTCEYLRGQGKYECPCANKRPLYSTDALRIHEGMIEWGKNGALYAEVMQVLERLWLLNILRSIESKGWMTTLRRLAIVLDGPLAVFGHPAWLSPAISQELQRINGHARATNGGLDILVIGIEKSGAFAQHLDQLDETAGGGKGSIPPGTVGLLTDQYIKRAIIPSGSSKPYGADTYFGRKLLYKTRTGALIAATLPFLRDDDRDTSRAEVAQYPRLADALTVLDDLFSSRYPNALAPLVAAHAEAAIPLNLGRRVLERLARDLITDRDT